MHNYTMPQDFIEACQQHMTSNDLSCNDHIITDGRIHRYSKDEKRSKRDEWYIAFEFTIQGTMHLMVIYGSWSDGSKYEFKSWNQNQDVYLDAETLRQLNEQAHGRREAAERELREAQSRAAVIAQEVWEKSSDTPPSENHLHYPKAKGIEAIGAKFTDLPTSSTDKAPTIVLPLKNIHGEIRSLQFLILGEDGKVKKRFLTGGEKKGNFHIIGEVTNDQPIYIVEGWATGVSVHTAKLGAVVIAYDAGNIIPVIENIKIKFPQHSMIIAGDNDKAGITEATEATKLFGCTAMFPQFPEDKRLDVTGKSYTDFNDLHQVLGIDEVCNQLSKAGSTLNKKDESSLANTPPLQNDPCAEFSAQHLPPLLSAYVQSICETTNAHPIMVTSAVLGMVSAFVGRRVFIFEDTYFQTLYPNLWMINITESGQFKSTALNKGAKLAFERSRDVGMRTKDLRKELLLETDDKIKKELNKNILEVSLQDVMLPNKFTTEALLEHLSQGHSGIILTSEFGGWLLNLEKSYNGDLKALLTELYDVPRTYRYKTRTQGDFILNDPYISICGVSTLAWLKAHIRQEDLASGFLARFLIFAPPHQYTVPPALPTRKIQPDPSTEQAIRDVLKNMDDTYEYTLSESAKSIFDALHQEIYKVADSYNDKCRTILEPHTKRWSPYLLKIAMIMQLFMDKESKEIESRALFYAYKILLPAIKSTALLVAEELGESEHQGKCRKVYNWICMHIKKYGQARRDALIGSHTLDGGANEYDYILNTLMEQSKIIDIKATLKKDYTYALIKREVEKG